MTGNGPGTLSTHVLNTAQGVPAEGVKVELWRLDPEPAQVVETVTNADGRTRDPLLLMSTAALLTVNASGLRTIA